MNVGGVRSEGGAPRRESPMRQRRAFTRGRLYGRDAREPNGAVGRCRWLIGWGPGRYCGCVL